MSDGPSWVSMETEPGLGSESTPEVSAEELERRAEPASEPAAPEAAPEPAAPIPEPDPRPAQADPDAQEAYRQREATEAKPEAEEATED